jgi:hypothetical protein
MDLKAPGNSVVPRSSESPLNDERLRKQVAQMFGESLLGPWPELEMQSTEATPRRRLNVWARRFLVLGASALIGAGSYALFRPGLTRQEAVVTAHYATEVRTFLNDGALAQAAQFLPMVYEQGADGETLEAHLDLTVFAEAILYRYYDAEPKRLEKIKRYLSEPQNLTPLRRLAQYTLLSRGERGQYLPELEGLDSALPNHNQVVYLKATALVAMGYTEASLPVWSRASKLGPAWLIQRFEQAKFEASRGNEVAAKKLAIQIVRVDPESLWAKIAMRTFAVEAPAEALSVRATDAGVVKAAVPSPLEIYYDSFESSLAASRSGDRVKAKAELIQALAQVHNASVFALDAFDDCVQAKQYWLAAELTHHQAWPSSSVEAQGKAERLTSLVKSSP